ncbi:MAG: hypothetical protein DWQ37_06720 [Planctomycetota bacterium]|nr:MAG: hypothetical protein DWQ37_06720 [Planctomycetota bacterium]
MEDAASRAPHPTAGYCCPGEPHAIDRVTHLARLAAFYPACLTCSHRDDTAGLSALQLQLRAEVERRHASPAQWTAEGLLLPGRGRFAGDIIHRMAMAVAAELWQHDPPSPPQVLVGHDGHWSTADFVPTACQALAWAGCQAVEIGAVSAPTAALAVAWARASAALWMVRDDSSPGARRIALWRADGRPSSSPGALDSVAAASKRTPSRPKRGGGGRTRFSPDEPYLATFDGLFHALRPLVFVLDTDCEPLARSCRQLTSASGCRMVRAGGHQGPRPASGPGVLDSLRRDVVAEGAHFGMWIDGAGEACQLVDQRGELVPPQQLLVLLARFACRERRGAAVVVEPTVDATTRNMLAQAGANVCRGSSTRQGMHDAMVATGAAIGGGNGRLWFAGPPPLPDALLATSVLLAVLSESDRTLSEVVDTACGNASAS